MWLIYKKAPEFSGAFLPFSSLQKLFFWLGVKPMKKKHVLIVYYSLTNQTRGLLEAYSSGLSDPKICLEICSLHPLHPLRLPLRSNFSLLKAMWQPFWRRRCQIEDPCLQRSHYDHIIIAGPTWSFQPSAPILAFWQDYGDIVAATRVDFLISCRSCWRNHYWGLRRLCKKHGGLPGEPLLFEHASDEPWCTIGLLLYLRGIYANRLPLWLKKRYPFFGHSYNQWADVYDRGALLRQQLLDMM
ncbi:unknown protein [Desulfotalea psychrophila LSv54]|uniref:Flavodoxin-like domain-containing protein n=2 Tax=Desulfotalea psychrophila TaxID=84980 RepID=Q6AIN2_DESPS|nr:unknown protein [Desulfotalea psychrophila LSv54]